jgi:glycosyltransferase involved in cell wall biosynthesis
VTLDTEEELTENIAEVRVPAALSPYWSEADYSEFLKSIDSQKYESWATSEIWKHFSSERVTFSNDYGRSIFEEVGRYAAEIYKLAQFLDFDVVHAHDWMTYPAGVAVAAGCRKPLVVHVHSIEYDRSGQHVNQRIYDIERMGVERATKVIAVSHYTKTLVNRHYGVPLSKIEVVHNGVYSSGEMGYYRENYFKDRKVVLFLGRITFQKGPDYLVEAAARVVPEVPNVLFVMAGSGDMMPRMIERVHELGLGDHFEFPGFLRGKDVERMLATADLYVMPSVSEPFGISALEAINFGTPAIISRQSGVSEVLLHALKFDFWDVNKLSDLIINALKHTELGAELAEMARRELRRLRWEAAAQKVVSVYNGLC